MLSSLKFHFSFLVFKTNSQFIGFANCEGLKSSMTAESHQSCHRSCTNSLCCLNVMMCVQCVDFQQLHLQQSVFLRSVRLCCQCCPDSQYHICKFLLFVVCYLKSNRWKDLLSSPLDFAISDCMHCTP